MISSILGLVFIIISYILGSVPFGLLVAKYSGIGDIRNQGSGNIGATNVLRTGGKKLGAVTLLLDALKGFIPVYLAGKYSSETFAAFAALAAVLGHIFPVWLKFKGGKGVATTFAVYAALMPGLFVFIGILWLLVFYTFRISSLASLIAMIAAPVVAWFFASGTVCIVSLILSLLVIYKHKGNILRLLRGEEKSV